MLARLSTLLFVLSCVASCDSAADSGAHASRREGDAGSERDAGSDAGAAQDGVGGVDGLVGGGCSDDADCGGGRCISSERITGTPFPGGYCTATCARAEDCGERGVCAAGFRGAAGTCYLGCDRDEDCAREGYRCRVSATSGAGTCLPGPSPLPDGVVGSECSSEADCGGGASTCKTKFADNDAPGGYCTQACAVHADCGESGFCVSGVNGISLSIGTCYRTCSPPDGCRDGYGCYTFGGSSVEALGVCTVAPPAAAP